MSFRGRYPTRFRRSGGFKKSFSGENDHNFERNFKEGRTSSSFRRPRGVSNFYRSQSDSVRPRQQQYDRGRGQQHTRYQRGRNLRSPRSRFIRSRPYHQSRGGHTESFYPRRPREQTNNSEWFHENEEFVEDRLPFDERSSPSHDWEDSYEKPADWEEPNEEIELDDLEELLGRRSISPLLIKRTFGDESPRINSREGSYENRNISPLRTEHFDRESLHRDPRNEYTHGLRSRSPSQTSPRQSPRRYSRKHSLDRDQYSSRNENYYCRRESPERGFKRSRNSRSSVRREMSPFDEASSIFHRQRSLSRPSSPYHDTFDRNKRRRESASPYFRRTGSQTSRSSRHNLHITRRSRSPLHRERSVLSNHSSSSRINSPFETERKFRETPLFRNDFDDVNRYGSRESPNGSFCNSRLSFHQPLSPDRKYAYERDELFSTAPFFQDKEKGQILRSHSGSFVESQRMRQISRDERRGHEKRSESSIERFLNDCKKSVERKPDLSTASTSRDSGEYGYEHQRLQSRSPQRRVRGLDHIVVERGRSFERSISPNNLSHHRNQKNVLGSPTEWGNGKNGKAVVEEASENPVSDNLKSIMCPELEVKHQMNEVVNQSNDLETGKDNQILKSKSMCDNDKEKGSKKNIPGYDSLQKDAVKSENIPNLSPISQSSLGFKEGLDQSQPINSNQELSPISQHENFETADFGSSKLSLSPISQSGSFEKKEFSMDKDNLSGLSSISKNSLVQEKNSKCESRDSMQEFLAELERSCERSRSLSESSLEYKLKISASKNKILELDAVYEKDNKNEHDLKHQPFYYNQKRQTKCSEPDAFKFKEENICVSKQPDARLDHPSQISKTSHLTTNPKVLLSKRESEYSIPFVQSHDKIYETVSSFSSTSTQNMNTQWFSSKDIVNAQNLGSNSLDVHGYRQNKFDVLNLNPFDKCGHTQNASVENSLSVQRQVKGNPSQNQHVLQVLGPTNESGVSQNSFLPSPYLQETFSMQQSQPYFPTPNQPNLFSVDSNRNSLQNLNQFPTTFNQHFENAHNISNVRPENVYSQNLFSNTNNQTSQTTQWNVSSTNSSYFPEGMVKGFTQNEAYNSTGLQLSLTAANYPNLANQFNSHNQNQAIHRTETFNVNPAFQMKEYSGLCTNVSQINPSSQNISNSSNQLQSSNEYATVSQNKSANLSSQSFEKPPPVDIRKFLNGTFGPNYLSFLNLGQGGLTGSYGIEEDVRMSNPVVLNPILQEQYKCNPPTAKEMAQLLDGFVLFFDVKENSELEKDPFVVIQDSFAQSDKFGTLHVEESNFDVDFLPVPKKACVLRWRGLMLSRGEGFTVEEARRKAAISLINTLAHNFYTVQAKYSYYCGGKLPKFMLKTKEHPGVYKVVERDDIIKAVTTVLRELKSKGKYTGKGVDATSVKIVLDFIDNFFKDKNVFCELLFGGKGSMDYTLEDLKQISNLVKRSDWLQSRTIGGYGRGSYIAVSRKQTPQKLCKYLLANFGETTRYKLLPPQGPWIELLTPDAQYHPAILKSIVNTKSTNIPRFNKKII